tara:strand:+ start:2834 stop:5428 length:2595 start_codon:yes stop_codon:yes gene_type:complete
MKKIIFIILIFSFLHSQHDHDHDHDHDHSHGSGSIVGTVINVTTGNPIEYASVSLVNQNSNEVEVGQLTLLDGRFILSNFHKGNYKVSITFMGFESWTSEIINITDNNLKKDLGTIGLTIKSIESEDVNITEQKEAYEFTADKIVYTPEKDIIASSGSAEDVLTQAPLVSVDQDGEVSLRGNSNVNILVDGRAKRIDLGSISASQIKEVEVITSPSAKYDPEGMAGIINIVLKKGSKDGFNGILKFNGRHNKYYSLDKMNGFNFNGNYRKQKINFFSSFSLNNKFGNRSGYRNTTTNFYDDENSDNPIESSLVFYDYTDNKERIFYNFKIGADYYINDFLTISSQLKADHHSKKSTTTQTFTEPNVDPEISIEQDDKDNPNLDLEYLFIIDREYKDPDKALSFSINFHNGDDAEDAILIDSEEKITSFDAIHSAIDIDFSYKYPLNKASKIEFGYDGRIIDNSNKMFFLESVLFDADIIDDPLTVDYINNEFLFKRNLHGIFIEYENQLNDNFSIKPSIRIEKVDRDVVFNTNFPNPTVLQNTLYDDLFNTASSQPSYKIDSLEVYPYFNMTYNINKNENLQFGFGRRVERPGSAHGSWQVMPFPTSIYNEQFIFVGNPFLQPEYSNQYDLNYSRPIPMGFASLSLFYHDIENKVEWYDDDNFGEGFNDPELGDVLTFKNVDEAQSTGISFFGMIMGQSLGGSYTYTTQSDNDQPDDYELNENSERFNLFGKIRLPEEYIKIFDFEFGLYWMKMKLPSGTMFGNKGTTWADLGISKKFMDGRLTTSFTIDNIFDNGGFQMDRTKPVETTNYAYAEEISDVFNTRNGRTFKFTLKFDLGKKSDGRKKKFDKGHSHGGGGNMDMGY